MMIDVFWRIRIRKVVRRYGCTDLVSKIGAALFWDIHTTSIPPFTLSAVISINVLPVVDGQDCSQVGSRSKAIKRGK